jgi:two-component system sensor histidine kinase AlgZ
MAKTDPPAAATADDAGDTGSRAASLWPDTARMGAANAGSLFEASRFDPLHEQSARERWRLAARFDLCRPALVLRVLLFLQFAVALAALPLALGWTDAAARAAVLAFAALAGGLLWLPAVCALRGWLLRQRRGLRDSVLAALGGGAAAVVWALLAVPGLLPARAGAGLGSAAAGAALALLVWRWLGLRAAAAQPEEASARLAELQ